MRTGLPLLDARHGGQGILANEVVEVAGGPQTGKTQFLLQSLVDIVLPRSLGGQGMSAVFFDLDRKVHWDGLRKMIAVSAMQRELQRTWARRKEDPVGTDDALPLRLCTLWDSDNIATRALGGHLPEDGVPEAVDRLLGTLDDRQLRAWDERVERLVSACMRRVVVIHCDTAAEFADSLERCPAWLSKTGPSFVGDTNNSNGSRRPLPAVRSILIDSMGAFFWQVRAWDSPDQQDSYYSRIVRLLRNIMQQFSVSILCAKPGASSPRRCCPLERFPPSEGPLLPCVYGLGVQ